MTRHDDIIYSRACLLACLLAKFRLHFPKMDETPADTAAAAGTKRRADSDDGSSAEPQKKAKTLTSPRAKLSWTALTPELLGRIAKNLAVGPELVSFCTVVGKDVARVVKRMYLYRNDAYVIVGWARCVTRHHKVEAVRCLREKTNAWMDCNEGYWQKKCLGSKADANLYTVTVSKKGAKRIKLVRNKYQICGTICKVAYQWPNDRIYSSSFILAIGGVDVSNMSSQEATNLLKSEAVCKEGRVRISCIDTLSVLFSHPCIASGIGLDRVVRHLIENGMVDLNTQYFPSSDEVPGDDNKHMMPLLHYSALRLPQSFPVFKYLLTINGFDVNATTAKHAGLIHTLSLSNVPSDMLALLLKRPDLNVNATMGSGHTAVSCLVRAMKYLYRKEGKRKHAVPHSLMMDKLRLLLEAGANATLRSNSGRTPADYLIEYEDAIDLHEIEGGEQFRRDIGDVRALLGKYI